MTPARARDRIGVVAAASAMALFVGVALVSAAPGCSVTNEVPSNHVGPLEDVSTVDSRVDGISFESAPGWDGSPAFDSSPTFDDTGGFDSARPDAPPEEVDAPVVPCDDEAGTDAPACTLPPSTCVDTTWLASYADATCVDGTCKYDVVYTDCTATGEECAAGACHTVILK